METTHTVLFNNSGQKQLVENNTIDLVVTSPPYPMISMWDSCFADQDPAIKKMLDKNGNKSFEKMHRLLDPVWDNIYRALKPGGFACINIGDATRTVNGHFAIYPNHVRILSYLMKIGFTPLPLIIWRKQTNAPNKFMGSGMLPAGAYVTLEHEYILVVRKGGKREFKNESEKIHRRQSAYFWEERNQFFSDVWFDIKGSRQKLDKKAPRVRSGAFPFELASRLILMYSAKKDCVYDPFMGTGTTIAAAMACGRSSLGCEIAPGFKETIALLPGTIIDTGNQFISTRLSNHMKFVKERLAAGKPFRHTNEVYQFPVMTRQEKDLILNELIQCEWATDQTLSVSYEDTPRDGIFSIDADMPLPKPEDLQKPPSKQKRKKQNSQKNQMNQMELF